MVLFTERTLTASWHIILSMIACLRQHTAVVLSSGYLHALLVLNLKCVISTPLKSPNRIMTNNGQYCHWIILHPTRLHWLSIEPKLSIVSVYQAGTGCKYFTLKLKYYLIKIWTRLCRYVSVPCYVCYSIMWILDDNIFHTCRLISMTV